jgi:hypothetical protein
MSPIPPSKPTNKRRRTSLNIDSYRIHAVTERRKSERLCRSALDHERLERATPSMMKSTESDPSGVVVAKALSPPTAKPRIVSSALNSFSMSPVTSRTSVASTSSAREIHLNVPTLLFGSSGSASDVGLLGRPMPLAGKAFVMEESARLASNLSPYPRVSFNKYSGAQEWGNNVLFLWINFGAPNSPVVNQFFDNGRKVNWFGGSRMHNTTPVISKLKQIGALAAKGGDDSNGSVVLWARNYCCLNKCFDPYVCLGRLAVSTFQNDFCQCTESDSNN